MDKQTKLTYLIICFIVSISFLLASFIPIAQAADIAEDIKTGAVSAGAGAGYPAGGDVGDLSGSIINLVNGLLTFIGIVFLLMMLYAGWLWMNARGNEEQVAKAKKIFIEAVIGFVIIILSRLFTEFLITQLVTSAEATT